MSFLEDVTNVQTPFDGKTKPISVTRTGMSHVKRHDPYGWKCLDDPPVLKVAISLPNAGAPVNTSCSSDIYAENEKVHLASLMHQNCNALVQFKCHQKEFYSPIAVSKGQYVVVQGDRGIDVGVVIRVNTDAYKTYVERSGPTGTILRHATQREVDYWAIDLKEDEAAAVAYCQQRVQRHKYDMEIRHAEYQFDKKKLTFYYTAKSRIDFVQLLKELYREFGCRIWMEKVRVYS
ncbi:hypothetical protein TRVL_02403 [Trypanosoma vivax]|nr:hypothetical protein TRVL_02403 [Trypanosoma vivax]